MSRFFPLELTLIWKGGKNETGPGASTVSVPIHLQEKSTPPYFLPIFSKGNNFHDFLFVSLDDVALPNKDLLLMERICSWRSKFLPLRVDLQCNLSSTATHGIALKWLLL